MFRRCIFCGWGRRECLEAIKFYSIPKEASLQRLQWMQALAEKRKNGLKKVDAVCSIHFRRGKPSNDSTNPDFVPHLYLNKEDIPTDLMKSILNHFSAETPEVREKKIQKYKENQKRQKVLKEQANEPKDAWKERKKERELKRAREAEEARQQEEIENSSARLKRTRHENETYYVLDEYGSYKNGRYTSDFQILIPDGHTMEEVVVDGFIEDLACSQMKEVHVISYENPLSPPSRTDKPHVNDFIAASTMYHPHYPTISYSKCPENNVL